METQELVQLILLLFIAVSLLAFMLANGKKQRLEVLKTVEKQIHFQLAENRKELNSSLKDNRQELTNSVLSLTNSLEEKMGNLADIQSKNAFRDREEQSKALNAFKHSFQDNVDSFKALQREKFTELGQKQEKMLETTEQKLEAMRVTVDEKLHKTLEERLGQSFKLVSERLEAVQKGLGEMHNLANGVGDLKRVLTNVKTRGVLGEIQLGNILEQLLTPDQYGANVRTSSRYNGQVEFAVKMPGARGEETIYLPIDAKFPQEDYIRLQEAYENGDKLGIETSIKALVRTVKIFAKDIHDKYLDPPNTTDFGIMFLPIEGLYAELVRQPDLLTSLQRDYKIALTGPTTLSAFLNSLQMGFKTLSLQKRSSDIHKTLEAVRTQFGLFGKVLRKAQDRIQQADKEIETLVTTRTNVMLSKLNGLEELPLLESEEVLELGRNTD
ncbi:MAG: DNA recombination protein RmuC [Flavobacteriales bacterium]